MTSTLVHGIHEAMINWVLRPRSSAELKSEREEMWKHLALLRDELNEERRRAIDVRREAKRLCEAARRVRRLLF